MTSIHGPAFLVECATCGQALEMPNMFALIQGDNVLGHEIGADGQDWAIIEVVSACASCGGHRFRGRINVLLP